MRRRTLGLAAILIVFVAMYARTIRYGYVWDDDHTLRDSDFFERPLGEQLFVTEMQRIDPSRAEMRGASVAHDSYRPLAILDQALDVRLFGRAAPGPMHGHNLLWGVLAILAAFALARRLLRSDDTALAVAAVFALHPLHVESFAYISARADLISGACELAALWLVIELAPPEREARSKRARVALAFGAGLVLLAALFAKESAVGTPLVALVLALACGRVRAWAPGWLAMLAAIPVWLVLRHFMIPNAPSPTDASHAFAAGTALPGLALQFFGELAAPLHLSIVTRPSVPALAGWIVVVAVIATIAVLWRRRRLDRPVAIAAAALVASVLWIGPAAVAVSSLGALASRYAYGSVFALALAVVALAQLAIARGGAARATCLVIATLWAALCLVVTFREIPAWASDEALYSHALAVDPDSALAHYHVGMLRFAAQHWGEAADQLAAAVELDPHDVRALNSLAVAEMNLGRFAPAEQHLRRAIDLTGGITDRAWFNLATIQLTRGQTRDACASLEHALAVNPSYERARQTYERGCR